jgi:hypothetical protein
LSSDGLCVLLLPAVRMAGPLIDAVLRASLVYHASACDVHGTARREDFEILGSETRIHRLRAGRNQDPGKSTGKIQVFFRHPRRASEPTAGRSRDAFMCFLTQTGDGLVCKATKSAGCTGVSSLWAVSSGRASRGRHCRPCGAFHVICLCPSIQLEFGRARPVQGPRRLDG